MLDWGLTIAIGAGSNKHYFTNVELVPGGDLT